MTMWRCCKVPSTRLLGKLESVITCRASLRARKEALTALHLLCLCMRLSAVVKPGLFPAPLIPPDPTYDARMFVLCYDQTMHYLMVSASGA